VECSASGSPATGATIGLPWPHRGGYPEPYLEAQLGLNLAVAQSLIWVIVLILRLAVPFWHDTRSSALGSCGLVDFSTSSICFSDGALVVRMTPCPHEDV
jgi:hypothetical protein